MNNKILIVDHMHESIIEMLGDSGFRPDYRPEITRAEILNIIDQYAGIVVRSKTRIDKELVSKATNLQFVARAGAGIDNVDYQEISSRNIKLVNAPEGNRDALGEHTVGMLLTLLHKINIANREVKQGIWNREGNRGWELKGKTVGIYGFGYMGSAFAKKLRGFDCTVLVYDKYKTGLSNEFIQQVDLQTFQKQTEILSLHVPLTSETKYLFDEYYLSQFPKLRILLNTARGEILSLKALEKLLGSSKLIGVGLDVLENEKIDQLNLEEQQIFDRLAKKENVIMTPHVAGWTFESYKRINEIIVSKLQKEGLAHVR
ncbi:MAG: phosphoglycerate dehydrogenase [Cyclobacteriaceae bacterium]|nr:phosphoglycerate dehydrogenase [Cyclobacteriaceae bacterium SS2]